MVVDAQSGRGVPLGVEVDDEGSLPQLGQTGADVDRRRRLADTAFLVGDGDHPRERDARRIAGWSVLAADLLGRRLLGRRVGEQEHVGHCDVVGCAHRESFDRREPQQPGRPH